jgi:hypothetical protein
VEWQREGQEQPADPVAAARGGHRADGGVAGDEEHVRIDVLAGAEAVDQLGVVGQPQQDAGHLQGHGQPP